MDDFFVEAPEEVSVKNQSKLLNDPFIYKNFIGEREEADLYFLTEKPLSKRETYSFKKYMGNKFPQIRYCVYSSIIIEPTKKDLEKSVVEFYQKNKIDMKGYIPEKSKIIALGRSLYALTDSDDLMTHYFYDNISEMYEFYHPDLKSRVWPIDSLYKWLSQDNFENIFASSQITRSFESRNSRRKLVKPNLFYIDRPNELLKDHMESKEIAWDTETSGFHPIKDSVGCLTLTFDGIDGYFLPWDKIDKELLNKFFENKYQILANGKFDTGFLRYREVSNTKVDFDTLNAGHLINEMRSNSLKTHAWLYTNYGGYDNELEKYKKQHNIKNYLDIPDPILMKYATMDAIVTFQTYKKMKKQLEEIDSRFPMNNSWSIQKYYYDIVIPSIEVFTDIELNGLYVDIEQLQFASDRLAKDIKETEIEIHTVFGTNSNTLDITSNPQLGKLFEKHKWKDLGRSKAGDYLTGADKLEKWSKLGYKEADLIIKFRELSTLMNTFVGSKSDDSGFWKYLTYHEEDDSYRVHGKFWVMLADSGRNKSYAPNLQNIPAHGWKAKLVRKYFIPPNKDYVFLSVDYSGYQLRAGAVVSNDEAMRDAFINQGGDLHSRTGQSVLMNGKVDLDHFIKNKEEEPYKKIRFKSKGFNFGCQFGAKAGTIRDQTIEPNWTLKECEQYIKENNLNILEYRGEEDLYYTVAQDAREKFFITYWGLGKYLENTKELAQKQGFIRSIYGAFRRLPQLCYKGDDVDNLKWNNLLNISLNSPIQNMEIVSVMRLMIEIHKWLKDNNMKSYFFGQIHDAIELIVHKDEIGIVCRKIKECAERDYPELKGIPLEVEGNVADYHGKEELWDLGEKWDKYLAS